MEDSKLSVKINGEDILAQPGQTVLTVALSHNIFIPNLCFQKNLGILKTCDMCFVEVNGEMARACATLVRSGMTIETLSSQVKEAQYEAMSRVLKNHDLYCTVCDNNNGNCEVHNTVRSLEIEHQRYVFQPKPYSADHSNPFYRYQPDQCILCGRCVEACQDLQVNETLTIDWNREAPRVLWDRDVPIDQSSCVSCGHCVTVCPCNALMEKSMLGEAGYLTGMPAKILEPVIELTKVVEPSYKQIFALSEMEAAMREARIKRTKTVCIYCGVGCSFEIWTKGRHILKVQPTVEAPVNGISSCVKGKFGWDFVNSKERLTKPLLRQGKKFVEASWSEALGFIAERLTNLKEQYGPNSIGFIASSKCSNEENYLFQKLARAVMGTNNVDNCSRYCQTPATVGLLNTVGIGANSGTIQDIANSELVLVIGANVAESHPVLATRIKRAHKLHGQKLIVIDLRANELAQRADLYLHPKPSTDLILLSAVSRYILDQGWEDREFLKNRVNGFEEYANSLNKFTLPFAEKLTGLTQGEIIELAKLIHEAKSVCILWAMGVTQHLGGTETSTAISNLLLITGNYGRPGTGAYPLRGHNNVQGACDFGAMPTWFPGYESVENPEVRARYERAWGVSLPLTPGLDNHQMVEGIEKGQIKALYLFGEDMALVDSNSNHVGAMFERLELLIVQDVFFSKTAQFADVILPATSSLEKEGTFTNTERRIQRFYQVFEPIGQSKPDWVIFQDLANRLGANWNYQHPSEIMAESASLTPSLAGVSYEQLAGWQSQIWPVSADGRETPLLFSESFGFPDGLARLVPVDWVEPYNAGVEYDLHLNNGRLLEHFHEGNMTYKSKGIVHKVPNPWLEVSCELAHSRGLNDGALVRLTSPYGQVEVRVMVTDRVRGNELYLTMNTAEDIAAVNRLTSSQHDRVTHTPNFKEMAVKLEVLQAEGEPPLPRVNHRFGHPVPQISVKIEQKWQRSDYTPLPEVVDMGRNHDGEAPYLH